MPKFKNYPELTTLAADDAILVVDTSDTTDAADGSTKYVQVSNLGIGSVVQSARFEGTTPSVEWSHEPGWSVSTIGTGKYNVTFPTAAPSAEAQVITPMAWRTSGDALYTAVVTDITTTDCTVLIYNSSNALTTYNFYVTRML